MRVRTIASGTQDSRVSQMRADLASRIARHVSIAGEQATPIPGLTLYRLTAPTACYAAEYETGMAIVVQGRKRVTLGRTTYVCDESTFFLTSVEVPLVSEVVAASENVPLLALFLRLDMTILREILNREEFKLHDSSFRTRPSLIGETGVELLQPCIRLMDLLDAPGDIPFFSSLIHREIVYRLLQSPQGDRLRAIAKLDHKGRGTAKALAWLRTNYTKPFHLEELAAMARMGISTFNHHFRAVTSISPLQYQKQLRLFAGRERMLIEGLDATRAALEVGYESTNQFTREYKRLFGEPPGRDVKAQQLAGSSPR